jgi:gas vesicle protein
MRNGDYYTDYYTSDPYENDAAGWSAFLAGAFIGAGLALLLAPQTGADLRGILRNYASKAKDEFAERGREAWDTAVERGKEYMERGQERLNEAGRSARDYVQSGQERMREAGREAATKIKDTAREATGDRG